MDAGVKTPQCPHLSSHYSLLHIDTIINLFRVLICRRFQSGRPQLLLELIIDYYWSCNRWKTYFQRPH